MLIFFSFIITFFATALLMIPLSKLASKYQLVDRPSARKIHSGDIPRIGGVAMVLSTILPILMWVEMDNKIIALLIGFVIIFVFGVWDDFKNLGYRAKFFGQIMAVLVVILYGDVQILRLPFSEEFSVSPYVSFFITFFVLLGVTNAINLADGLDGLAGGITLLSFSIIVILSVLGQGTSIEIIAMSIMGSVFGFLRFNTYPASVFMGDSGSQFLGFSLGVLTVMLTQQVNTAISPILPLLIIGLPLIDTLMVMSQRIYERKSPFKPDANHIHHKLLMRGFDHYEAVIIIYLLQAFFVVSAYLLRYQPDEIIIGLFIVFTFALLIFLRWTHETNWRFHKEADNKEQHLVNRYIDWLTHETRLGKWIYHLSIVTIIIYIIMGVTEATKVSADIAVLALVLVSAVLVLLGRQYNKPLNYIERACVFVGCTIVVYLVQTTEYSEKWPEIFRHLYLIVLGAAVALGIWNSKQVRLHATPMDFLVLFIACTVPNIPSITIIQAHFGFSVAILIITFYAVEMILNQISTNHNIVRYMLLFSMGLIALRGLL